MKKKKLAFAVIAVLLLVCSATSFVACYGTATTFATLIHGGEELHPHSEGAVYDYTDYQAEHDKVILFLPGLMASALYSNDAERINTWGYSFFFSAVGELIGAATNKDLTIADKQQVLDNLLKKIACDEDGVPYTVQAVANMNDESCYDAFEGMSYSYKLLEPYYKDTHDMIVWQYDWRQSVTGAAEELENFINYFGYKDVCFVTHSLGGAVVAQYLARSEANRDNTALFVPFAAPFFGSFDSVTYLFDEVHEEGYEYPTIDDYNMNNIIARLISGSDPGVNAIEFGSALVNYMMGSEFAITDITRNMASIYQMIPSCTALLNTPFFDETSKDYVGTKTPYVLAGKNATSDRSVLNYLNVLDWTHREDGELKPAVNTLDSYYSSLFFENDDGEVVFVTELVNTEYIVGIGCDTPIGVELDEKGQIVKVIETELGDYAIPAYSASAGLPLDHPRVHTVDKSHNYIHNDTSDHPMEETGLQFLLDIFKRNIG